MLAIIGDKGEPMGVHDEIDSKTQNPTQKLIDSKNRLKNQLKNQLKNSKSTQKLTQMATNSLKN